VTGTPRPVMHDLQEAARLGRFRLRHPEVDIIVGELPTRYWWQACIRDGSTRRIYTRFSLAEFNDTLERLEQAGELPVGIGDRPPPGTGTARPRPPSPPIAPAGR
jgi:hypothetical protein